MACYENLVFCFQNCSSDQEKNLKFKAEGRNLQNIWDHYNNLFEKWKVRAILETECFLTHSLRFLRSNKLEQLEFKLEKIILGLRNNQENLEKFVLFFEYDLLL